MVALVSHRAPPVVLPSLRRLLSPSAREGVLLSCESTDEEVDRAALDNHEADARHRAASAPRPIVQQTPAPPSATVYK